MSIVEIKTFNVFNQTELAGTCKIFHLMRSHSTK